MPIKRTAKKQDGKRTAKAKTQEQTGGVGGGGPKSIFIDPGLTGKDFSQLQLTSEREMAERFIRGLHLDFFSEEMSEFGISNIFNRICKLRDGPSPHTSIETEAHARMAIAYLRQQLVRSHSFIEAAYSGNDKVMLSNGCPAGGAHLFRGIKSLSARDWFLESMLPKRLVQTLDELSRWLGANDHNDTAFRDHVVVPVKRVESILRKFLWDDYKMSLHPEENRPDTGLLEASVYCQKLALKLAPPKRAGNDPSTWVSEKKLALLKYLVEHPQAAPTKQIMAVVKKAGAASSIERMLRDLTSAGWMSSGQNGMCLSEVGLRKAKKKLAN